MKIWDQGFYSFIENKPSKIKVVLMGEKVRGAFLIVRKDKNAKNWLMLKYMR